MCPGLLQWEGAWGGGKGGGTSVDGVYAVTYGEQGQDNHHGG